MRKPKQSSQSEMSMRKRNRACEECHRLKIKCDVSTSPSCDRCTRNNLECVPAAPRLQRDRINELEAQVEELRNALRAHSGSTGTTPSRSPTSTQGDCHSNILAFLDARIPVNTQAQLLVYFQRQTKLSWPFVDVEPDLVTLRNKSPVLLISIIAHYATKEFQGTEVITHDDIVGETLHFFGEELFGKGHRSLEMVQALLVASFWNKPQRGRPQASCYQMIQLAADMAIDLGIAGVEWQPSPAAFLSMHSDPGSLQARTTWLSCYIALSFSSISMHRPNPVPWNQHHQDCLDYLERRGDLSDLLLGQIVRITKVMQEIAIRLGLCQISLFFDGNDPNIHTTMAMLREQVDAWAAQVPPSLASSEVLKVLHDKAVILIHEPLLHTPTNKSSFTAPFIPSRIPVKDFPNPTSISPTLPQMIHSVIYTCHSLIDTATSMSPDLIVSLPSFCFAPAVLYSLFVLLTALVTCTDPKSTYKQFVSRDSFRIEECGVKLRSLTLKVKGLDPCMSSWTTRMFDATGWLEDWYGAYLQILKNYESLVHA